MEKRDARRFQPEVGTGEHGWNIVELESRRHLRQRVQELIRLASDSTLTTSEIRHDLLHSVTTFGDQLATQLVRSLRNDDERHRESVVWLLILLDDQDTIPHLQRMSLDKQLSRPIRLSASLVLAGMGATAEMMVTPRQKPLYAIG